MPWYRSGTVSITAGQTTVTGTSTDFALNARVGDAFQGPDGRWYEVANIASSTVLSILPAYQGPTVTAGSYGLAPMQGYVKEAADRLRQLVEQFGSTLALLGNPADVAALRVNIGAASRGANSDITSITGMTTALSVAQGGTGSKTAEGARSALGLSSAATATITTSADDMVVGRLLKVGDRGIGVGLSTRSTSSPTSRVYLGGWDFSYVDSGVSGSVDGCMLTMNYGQPVYAVQIFGDWRTNLLKVRSVVNSGAFGEWATLYSTQNTTRAADGTLKAI